MRKFLLTLALVIGISAVSSAQSRPRAVGVKIGYGAEFSWQQYDLRGNFIEANLGMYGFKNLNIAATYNWLLFSPHWTRMGEWGIYAGGGVATGLGGGTFNLCLAAQVGIEYHFDFPLVLSVDIRPQFGLLAGDPSKTTYFGGYYPALGIKYRF